MKTRRIEKVVRGSRQVDGAGVSLVRVFGFHDVGDFDPFLSWMPLTHMIRLITLRVSHGTRTEELKR